MHIGEAMGLLFLAAPHALQHLLKNIDGWPVLSPGVGEGRCIPLVGSDDGDGGDDPMAASCGRAPCARSGSFAPACTARSR